MSRGTSPSPSTTHPPFVFPSSSSSGSLRSSNLRIKVENSSHRMRSNTSFSPPSHADHFAHPRSLSQQLTPLEASDARDVALAVRNLRGDMDSPVKVSHPLREMVLDEEEGERRVSPDDSTLPRERSNTPSRMGGSGTGSGSGSGSTMSGIFKALEKSPDEGDTLDLSRKAIDGIGDAEVEMFRKGVGKDQKGVWRYASARCSPFRQTQADDAD